MAASRACGTRGANARPEPTEGKHDHRGWTYILVMFAEHHYKPAWFTLEEVNADAKRTYHPGQNAER